VAVTQLEISDRRPYAEGKAFGEAGNYEYIQGQMHYAVDPNDPHNSVIADLDLAPRNAEGKVEFSTEFAMVKPVTALAGGRLLYDVTNRGNKTAMRLNLAGPAQPSDTEPRAGDGFLMRHGFSVAWLGWQPDAPSAPGMMRGNLPEALQNGQRISGQTFLQFQHNKPGRTQLLSDAGHQPLPALDLNEAAATLTVRDYHDGPPTTIARSQWQFAKAGANGEPEPNPNYVYYAPGFEPGKVYEITYTTIGAPVMGLGLIATRDCVSWLCHAGEADGNPLAGGVASAYGWGVSMSGRYLREFLYQGMNQDEAGRQVFDGLVTVVGSSRRGEFNFRFAQPSTNIARAPGNLFPFSYVEETDPDTGKTDSLLARTRAQGAMPKLIAINSGMEYFWSAAALQHVDVTGARDLDVPDDVRVYYFCGTQHGAGAPPLAARMADGTPVAHLGNTIDPTAMQRAALVNLDRWVRDGVEPPPSAVPSVGAGTAVRRETLQTSYESIPGGHFPKHLPRRPRMDYGPEEGRGVLRYPPVEGEDYVTMVSALNEDLNEVGGVRPIDLRVPLATYTGWNVRADEAGQGGEFVSPMPGSALPFTRTRAEREQSGDPRQSLEERYRDKEDFLGKVRDTIAEMQREGHLLAEDAPLVLQQQSDRWDAYANR
jgi:hypothetical protein